MTHLSWSRKLPSPSADLSFRPGCVSPASPNSPTFSGAEVIEYPQPVLSFARTMCQSRGTRWAASYLCTTHRYPGKGRVSNFCGSPRKQVEPAWPAAAGPAPWQAPCCASSGGGRPSPGPSSYRCGEAAVLSSSREHGGVREGEEGQACPDKFQLERGKSAHWSVEKAGWWGEDCPSAEHLFDHLSRCFWSFFCSFTEGERAQRGYRTFLRSPSKWGESEIPPRTL